MILPIDFIKMHGLGNDFVIIYQDDRILDIKDFAIQISDRKLGIGCDQFIIINHHPQLEMIIYNQDGSRAKMCGNAARCVTKLIAEEIKEKSFNLLVSGRLLECSVRDSDLYSVNMGHASFSAPWMLSEEALWDLANSVGLSSRDIMLVDMGNPHLVIIQQNLSQKDKYILGSKLEKHILFPDGVNVDFVSIDNGEINLEVWERGAGFTLACGSGACASFAACLKLGFIQEKSSINFKLGSLFLENSDNGIILTGPASLVCKGVYCYTQSS
jgi:diaminopimelate epimerase